MINSERVNHYPHVMILWLCLNNKILTRVNLCLRGWLEDSECVFCGQEETVDHLFLHCPFSNSFWSTLNNCRPLNNKLDISSISALWLSILTLSGIDRKNSITLLAAFFWSVWNECNRLIFHESSGRARITVYASALSFFHFWTGGPADFADNLRTAHLVVLPRDSSNVQVRSVVDGDVAGSVDEVDRVGALMVDSDEDLLDM